MALESFSITQMFPILRSINLISLIVRLSLAMIAGFVIGLERGMKGRAAGIKTHIFVCHGSAMAMILSQYIVDNLGYNDGVMRLGAQVISGISFLGAGTILVTGHNRVIGLSTAAGLWASACIGLVAGIGFYEGAIVCCIAIVFVRTVVAKVEEKITNNARECQLYIEFDNSEDIRLLVQTVEESKCSIIDIEIGKVKYSGLNGVSIVLYLAFEKKEYFESAMSKIGHIEGLTYLQKW